jgi:hypothetical protein
MDRRNTYHGQIVSDGDVDEWFDDVEGMEENMALDVGLAQALLSATPDAAVFGGIVTGLGVTGVAGQEYVTVALGAARDNAGQRVKMTASATVKISHTGTTPIGDSTLVVGDAGAITGTCGAGQYIVASLFIAQAQLLGDAVTDALGATVYYDVLESFRFQLEIGSAGYAHATPLLATPTRAALANGRVLLADIVLTNSGGTMQVVAVMNTTPDWITTFTPPGNYANITGRRADLLVVQSTDEFASADAAADVVRAGTVREALYSIAKRVRSEAFTGHRKLSAPALFSKRGIYGHPARPHEFFDDMFYNADAYDAVVGTFGPFWTPVGIVGGLGTPPFGNRIVAETTLRGGVICLTTSNVSGEGVRLYTPAGWDLGASPWAIASFRVRVGHNDASQSQQIGFTETLGVNTNQVAFLIASSGTSTAVVGYIYDSAGAVTSVNLGSFTAGTWYTLRIAVLDNAGVYFQLNAGAWTRLAASGTLASTPYRMYAQSYTTDGAVRYLYIDQAYAADAQLVSDLIP